MKLQDVIELKVCSVCDGSKVMPVTGSKFLVAKAKKDTTDRPCHACSGEGTVIKLKYKVEL